MARRAAGWAVVREPGVSGLRAPPAVETTNADAIAPAGRNGEGLPDHEGGPGQPVESSDPLDGDPRVSSRRKSVGDRPQRVTGLDHNRLRRYRRLGPRCRHGGGASEGERGQQQQGSERHRRDSPARRDSAGMRAPPSAVDPASVPGRSGHSARTAGGLIGGRRPIAGGRAAWPARHRCRKAGRRCPDR